MPNPHSKPKSDTYHEILGLVDPRSQTATEIISGIADWIDHKLEKLIDGGIDESDLIDLFQTIMTAYRVSDYYPQPLDLKSLFGDRQLFPYLGRNLVTTACAKAIIAEIRSTSEDYTFPVQLAMQVRDALLANRLSHHQES